VINIAVAGHERCLVFTCPNRVSLHLTASCWGHC
jgi:hypothetical protein